MSWLTSLFSSKNPRTSTRTAMTSTHEAFSLPTSSPSQSTHPDAFNPDTLVTAGFTPSSSYSYPPSSPSGQYYDVPPAGARSKNSTILPLHQPSTAGHPYPPLAITWARLRQWLGREYPELGDTLNYGILPQDLAQLEMAFGFALPTPVRESYLCVDGQEPESSAGCAEGLFFGLTLLPLEDVLEEWRFWREVDDDPATGANPALRELMQSIPPGWVRREYSCRGWIPLVADKAGNYLGIDMNPGEGGAVGQVIVFGRDFDTKVVMWRGDGPAGWAKFLAGFVEDLESGEGYELGSGAEGSDGSEDSVGYNSYFFDGVGGGQGDTGGDAGTAGLRLAGEYKGWNVLEAWADKSVRRWIDAGVVPENILQASQEKGKEKASLDPSAVGSSTGAGGAEVPIPVLADAENEKEASALDVDESSLPTPLGNVTNFSQRQQLPTISVTKPPAPLQLNLPSMSNLNSPSDDEDSAFPRQDDIEGNPAVQEQESVSASPLTAVPSRMVRERAASPQPAVDTVITESPPVMQPTVTPPVAPPTVPDLLVDDATLAGPSQSQSNPAETVKSEEDSPVLVDAADASSQDPDTTIRLIGGGGVSGTIDDTLQADGVLVDEVDTTDAAAAAVEEDAADAAAEVASITSVDSKASTSSKKHGKKKSISAGLKKLGQLGGGKRRTDSVTSVDLKHSQS
ncbi:hypothetical protein BD413DRAFT_666812 [Trametes elegans]|nr:hypothetical protein BD413DRAFT_666812 [Trametes elegans]